MHNVSKRSIYELNSLYIHEAKNFSFENLKNTRILLFLYHAGFSTKFNETFRKSDKLQ